ncbi:MAG: hypothetical protein WBE37_32420 [Bryobacteraceae bacterium]
MQLWKQFRKLLEYLSPEPSLVSPRKHIDVIAALLAVAAIAGAVVLTPSHRARSLGAPPDVWEILHQHLSKRAQVDLFDDFSQGVDDWQSGENLASTWSYDKNGFVNPGSLSLFAPSMHLTDYDLDAVVQIESKGVGLAFRAASTHTYQAVNLLVEGSGAMPSLAVERYAVISGQPSRVVRTRCPEQFLSDMLYHVHLEVRGNAFSLYVQGKLMDYWSDARLTSGGVGLFCSKGEHARIAWVRVSHNADSLGKTCSLLASMF